MLKTSLVALACLGALVVAVLIMAATKPDTFQVERTATIQAPPAKIFPLIDDLKQWAAWSPYEHRDPDMKRTFGATTAGKGATYGWDGNNQVGAGLITITNITAPSQVLIDLDMQRPISARNKVVFTLEPQGNATKVTWAMHGDVSYVAKILHVFVNMDRMVGGDFEAGLANLKTIAEKQ